MDQIKALIEKAQSDKELMAKLDALGEKDAGADEIIALAKEYGITVNAEEIEKLKSEDEYSSESGELTEEELEDVAGGAPSENRYDPKTCKNMTRTKYNCVGFLTLCWCDHYRQDETLRTKIGKNWYSRYFHSCTKNAFPRYYGNASGDKIEIVR